MALFDQQQQQQEPENQLQPYGVSSGTRVRSRVVQHVPYVPVNMDIGQPLFRARQLHAHPVREQHHAMLQDRVNQDMLQHNTQQDNIACNPRPYQDRHRLYECSCTKTKQLSMCEPCGTMCMCRYLFSSFWRSLNPKQDL